MLKIHVLMCFCIKMFCYRPNTSHLIMTSPLFFSNNKEISFYITPGEVYNLQFQLVDELCQNIAHVMFTASCVELVSPYVLLLYRFTKWINSDSRKAYGNLSVTAKNSIKLQKS